MTSSDCWVDTVDDTNFKGVQLPPTVLRGEYWISILSVWARKHGLTVQYVHEIKIQVAVTRMQLLQFLDDVFWPAEEAEDRRDREIIKHWRTVERVEELRAHTRQFLRDDRTYLIVADEF